MAADLKKIECCDPTDMPPMEDAMKLNPEGAPVVLEETATNEGHEAKSIETEIEGPFLAPKVTKECEKMENVKKSRKTAKQLAEEKGAVLDKFKINPGESPLAVAIDLGIPEDRVLRYWLEWKSMKETTLVCMLNKAMRIILGRLKTASGEPLAKDTPLKMEFDGNKVTLTPYEKV